jgi:chemotaxis protein CheD
MINTARKTEMIIIGIGEYRCGAFPMSSIGLGSCVGLIIHDRDKGTGGLAHVMLPCSQGKTNRPGKYADTALDAILGELIRNASNNSSLIAKIAGGSSMFKGFSGNLNIGERNVEVIRKVIREHNIPIRGEDVGGTVGRSITYNPSEKGRVTIRKGDGTIIEI